jgi:hypothetical protein
MTSADPLEHADIAALIPAGPPPTIKILVATLVTRDNLHPSHSDDVATALMWHAVYRHTTFEADSHPAERSPHIASDGGPKCIHT